MGADTVTRTAWFGDNFTDTVTGPVAPPPPRSRRSPASGSQLLPGVDLDGTGEVTTDAGTEFGAGVGAVAPESLTISHARSLRGLPLDELRAATDAERMPLHLDAGEARALLSALRSASEAASARLADNARAHLDRRANGWSPRCPADVVAALHRILTRSRFLKGSRSCFPLSAALEQMLPFVETHRPVTILASGFPFKQHDNGLKAAGPWPDLAELGALLRLKELQRAFAAVYPPGLYVVVLNDGGYSRPRASVEMQRYRRQLQRYAQLVGLGGSVIFHDQSRFVAGLLGREGWEQRERYRRAFAQVISLVVSGPRDLHSAARADRRLAQALPSDLVAGVPSFRDILSSLVYSVPVPAPPRTNPRRWACDVLARPDEYSDPSLPPEIASARRAVLSLAWGDAVNHLSASLADLASGVAQRYPPHIRLATVASRQGCSGFSYLGGSALLPWHGTGCLDGRGLLCAEFLVSLDHRGYLPVYSDFIGDDQPLLLVPYARTVFSEGRRRVDPELLGAARLRPR